MSIENNLMYETDQDEFVSTETSSRFQFLNHSTSKESLKSYLGSDLLSGFIVALVALPLNIGIAYASGFPALSGIYTTLIGGLIISFIAGTHLDIKGTSSGLYFIIATTVHYFASQYGPDGALSFVLACLFGAACLQLLFAIARLGFIGDIFPSSAILGMMASFGLMLALKQVYIFLGSSVESKGTLELITNLPKALQTLTLPVTIVGIVSLLIMVLCGHLPDTLKYKIPGPLLVLLVTIPLSIWLDIPGIEQQTGGEYLVSIPGNILEGVMFPDFTYFLTPESLGFVFLIAFAGSVETITSSKALEMADPLKRKTRLNKDLFAIGIGNIILSTIGGLPMTSDAKRGMINVNFGAKTAWSNVFHAVFVLFIVVVAGPLIKYVPLSAFAGILIYFSYKLISPKQISSTYNIGKEQLIVFLATLVTCMFSNLVVGLIVGIVLELIIYLSLGIKIQEMFKGNYKVTELKDHKYRVMVSNAAIFSNFYSFKKISESLPPDARLMINFADSKLIDHTFITQLHFFEEKLVSQGGSLELEGLDYHFNLGDHPLASRRIIDLPLQLKPRQESLMQYAVEKSWKFDARSLSNVSKYEQFMATKHMKIVALENVMTGRYRSVHFEISDPIVHHTINHRVQKIKMTAAFVSVEGLPIPDFILEPDGFTDDFAHDSSFKLQDINFEEHSTFSFYYLLTGTDEYRIRGFFTEELIKLFERNKGYRVECHNHSLFIYTKARRIKPEHMDTLYEFLQSLIDILMKKVYQSHPSNYIP